MINTSDGESETTKLPQVSKKSSDTLGIYYRQIQYCVLFYNCLNSFSINCNVLFLASAAFLTCVAAGAGIFAFASTLASSRKTDPNMFSKGQIAPAPTAESGVQLAIRALKWGSFYAFGGCGLFFYGVWKMSGANDASIFSLSLIIYKKKQI